MKKVNSHKTNGIVVTLTEEETKVVKPSYVTITMNEDVAQLLLDELQQLDEGDNFELTHSLLNALNMEIGQR